MNKKIRILIYFFALTFLGVTTFFLMGYPIFIPIEICFGLGYVIYALTAIKKRIDFLNYTKIPKIKLNRMKEDFNFFGKLFYPIFAVYSGFIFYLASRGVKNNLFSSLWLIEVIFVFQGFCFLYFVNYIGKHKPKTLLRIFSWSYIILSAMFGWTSAQIAYNILKLPVREDLFFATYGLLILPVIFIVYFDYVFNYKPKAISMEGWLKKK